MKMNGISIVLEKLLSILIVFLVFSSCEQQKDIETVKNKEVNVRLLLHTADMAVASNSSATRVDDGIMDASLGAPAVTRAASALTTEEEAKVNSLSYFEFNGTADDSRCVKKGYIPSVTTENIATLPLTSSTDIHKVYVVANLGDVTTNIIEDASGTSGTLLSTFKGSTYPFQSDTLVATKGLPMIGSVDMVPATKNGSISLLRLVARINVICNVNVPLGESFVCQSMQIKDVPNNGRYVSVSNYPDNNFASNFTNYSPLNTNSGVWYIPENRQGTVSNTANALKNTIAPSRSTYVDMTGIYTHAGIKKEVTYRFYLGGNMVNNFDILANTSYTLYVTVKGYNETDGYVAQLVTDLSQNPDGVLETANSYITSQGGKYYKFNATIMGNGKVTPAVTTVSPLNITQNAPVITPAPLSPKNAFVVWETGSKGSVIEDGSVTLGVDGYVRFKTANNTTNGNAVIAVRDAANNILWSWHIWKVPYNPNSDYHTYTTFAGRSFKMMKYNLGTTEITNYTANASNSGDLGLLYQWGRKDPFTGALGWSGSIPIPVTYATGYGRTFKVCTELGTVDNSILFTTKNPTTFILWAGQGDWLNAANYSNQRDNLWGNPRADQNLPNLQLGTKSIYDPCPPGWRVPPSDSYTRFTKNGNSTENPLLFNISEGPNKGFVFYTQSDGSGQTAYYPKLMILRAVDGSLIMDGLGSFYWLSSPSYTTGNANALSFFINDNKVYVYFNQHRAVGMPIRCAQE